VATYNKFTDFANQLLSGTHELGASSDVVKVYLASATPSADDTTKASVAEISAENGYPSGGSDITNVVSAAKLKGTDVVFTASGGTVGPFRYAVIYNDTAASDNLIAWWDYGSAVTLQDGETFTVDFGSSILSIA